MTWNNDDDDDVANGPRVWRRGRITAHWTSEQIRRDVLVDYVRGPSARVGPQISAPRTRGGGGAAERTVVVVPRLIFDIGAPRASFLTGDRTQATRTRDVSCVRRKFVCTGALCTRRVSRSPPLFLSRPDTFFCSLVATTGKRAIFFTRPRLIYDVLRKLRVYLYLSGCEIVSP